MKEPVLIVGTGAMACLFAARLAAGGMGVTMLGSWEAGLAALQADGVRLREADGREQRFPVRATSQPAECGGIPRAIVLVKSWQTPHAAARLARALPPDGVALSLQNGLGNRETLAQALGAERVALGVTTVGAALVAPGVVQAGGTGVTSLGPHGRANSLREMLRQADFSVDVVTNLDSLLWGKLAINAGINPLTALLRIPNGQLLHRPTATALMHAAARETATVAAALGISLPFPDPAAAVTAVATRTAGNISSMLQDIQRGAPTEIEAICGEIIRAGESVGIPTPINRTLYQLVAALAAPPDEPLPQNP